jgi:hypothetical protein
MAISAPKGLRSGTNGLDHRVSIMDNIKYFQARSVRLHNMSVYSLMQRKPLSSKFIWQQMYKWGGGGGANSEKEKSLCCCIAKILEDFVNLVS